MRMLAQAMQWEMQLAHVMVPASVHSKAVEAILSTTAKNTIDTGYSLAGGRASPERLFPLLDGISCMHDPYVLPLMKLAFKEEALKHLKQKFHDLLGYQYEQAQHCVESFSASVSNNIVLRKEVGNIVTVAQQTAFVMRVLKVLCPYVVFCQAICHQCHAILGCLSIDEPSVCLVLVNLDMILVWWCICCSHVDRVILKTRVCLSRTWHS